MRAWQSIIVMTKGEKIELWGTLPEVCENHPDFSLSYIRKLNFPFVYKGWDFNKVQYRKKAE